MKRSISRRSQPVLSPENRRREERVAASGNVTLRPANLPDAIIAQLVDVSASGFRAAFSTGTLSSGEEVTFTSSGWSGVAVVVWSRIAGNMRECGFLVRKVATNS